MNQIRGGSLTAGLMSLLLAGAGHAPAQLNQNCVVGVLNRTVSVAPDGSWVLPNIPANFGPVRARATCVNNGVTTFGESAPFIVPVNGGFNIPAIQLGSVSRIPTAISITAPSATLMSVGATVQLTVMASYATGSPADITAGSTGTVYNISNPAIATVSADGLVTAVTTGNVLIQAQNEGTQGLFMIHVILMGADSDHDGIPDDAEMRLGLNPHDPTDAFLDPDHDGLTNLDEYRAGTDIHNPDTDGDGLTDGQEVKIYHTNPLVADSDHDGVPDGVEITEGTNPNDNTSFTFSGITSVTVTPTSFVLNVNSLNLLASQQLTVTGHLANGSTIDLTSTARGTTYASSDLTVCNFGNGDGNVSAGQPGSCTITVGNTSHGLNFTINVSGVVTNFTPMDLSYIAIPGFANGVDVNGNYAYVAAGASGLQVVNVSDRTSPSIAGSLSLAGNSNAVTLAGNTAFIAGGMAGLQAVDVTNPASPKLLGSFSTADTALAVRVVGSTAYVANSSNLVLVNITNPASMSKISSVAIPSANARGVDVDLQRGLAMVTSGSSLYVVDISSPTLPSVVGSVSTGDARAVKIRGVYAFVADYSNSLVSVDTSTPTAPQVVSMAQNSSVTGGFLQDCAINGNFGLGADVKFVNGVPTTDISDPTNLLSRNLINFTQRDDNGQGIAADANFVYLVTEHNNLNKYGTTGDSRLYIGQYRPQTDTLGVAPTVSIMSPTNGMTVVQGAPLTITLNATDDVAVAAVNFYVNGNLVFSKTATPYTYTLMLPTTGTSLSIGASAIDFGGNLGTAQNLTLNLIPDPGTTVTGKVVDKSGNSISGATVTFGTHTTTSAGDGTFTLNGVPTVQGNIVVLASATIAGKLEKGRSASTAPVPGGVTSVGNIKVSTGGIGLLECDGSDATVTSYLVGTGTINMADITVMNICNTPPTIDQLSSLGSVLVWTNESPTQPDALGNVLADFVDQGGGVVLATYSFSQSWKVAGRIINPPYSPFGLGAPTTPSGMLDLAHSQTTHPVMQGVTAGPYFVNSNYSTVPLQSGATVLAVDTGGNNVVALNANNTVIGISIYPGESTSMGQLFANALNYLR